MLSWLVWLAFFAALAACFDAAVEDKDWSRQICSGMYANDQTYINVTFESSSQGHVAMVIYEWQDAEYLGKAASPETYLPKTYVCTSNAYATGLCGKDDLGKFILDLPASKSIDQTTFWNARVALPDSHTSSRSSNNSFWNNPEGNPTLPDTSPDAPVNWLRASSSLLGRQQEGINSSPNDVYVYQAGIPIHYLVRKTGYYCVAIIPVSVMNENRGRQETDVPYHPSYSGNVHFHNAFEGKLAATDYPKVIFYTVMLFVYLAVAAAWAFMCWKHVNELLPIQYYISGLVGLLLVEMVANLVYYRYLNAHGRGTASTVFLIVVAIFDAGRNSMSFFLLLVVALGLSVVRESLGRLMIRCQILTGFHFVFGILYAVGIVELELESTSAFVLLLFVIPLAFTLSGFLLWIMYSLNATIAELKSRRQKFKLAKFEKLNRILLLIVLVIAIFFVVSSFSFSGRLAEDYAAKSWRVRWWLLDGWLALLYFFGFISIAYLWRPSEGNRRLIMSDELAQDEEEAEDYDMDTIQDRAGRRRNDDDDDATLVGGSRHRGPDTVGEDDVVFEIGDEEPGSDDEEPGKRHRRPERLSGEQVPAGGEGEREGLMTRSRDD